MNDKAKITRCQISQQNEPLCGASSRLLNLLLYYKSQWNHVFPSQGYLAKKLGISIVWVNRLIKRLVEKGYIRKFYYHRHSCHYYNISVCPLAALFQRQFIPIVESGIGRKSKVRDDRNFSDILDLQVELCTQKRVEMLKVEIYECLKSVQCLSDDTRRVFSSKYTQDNCVRAVRKLAQHPEVVRQVNYLREVCDNYAAQPLPVLCKTLPRSKSFSVPNKTKYRVLAAGINPYQEYVPKEVEVENFEEKRSKLVEASKNDKNVAYWLPFIKFV